MKNFNFRTDFIDELVEVDSENDYVMQQIRNYNNVKTNHILIKKYSKSIGRPIGDYLSISFESLYDKDERLNVEKVIDKNLHELFKKYNISEKDKVLVVGMGNRNITPDALGPMVISNVMITNHLFMNNHLDDSSNVRKVAALVPGVMGTTGMETSDIIYGVCKQFKPNLVICIDALATKSVTRINKAIQISDTGISPGSGINNHRKRIDYNTIKCPVITIGVATVVDSLSMFHEYLDLVKDTINIKITNPKINKINEKLIDKEMNLIVTPKEIDEDLKNLSSVISNALNNTLHQNNENL